MVHEMFEFVRLLKVGGGVASTALAPPPVKSGTRRLASAEFGVRLREPSIHCYAYTSNSGCNYLALGLATGSLLLYRLGCGAHSRPLLKHIAWYQQPGKQVAVMCFDPTGSWLLLAAKDATLFLLPALLFVEPLAKLESEHWSAEDATEIKLTGRRAIPTAICWWQTSDGQPVAIVGNELGEISFINLHLKAEVGGTYITVCIAHMEIVRDLVNTCSYLLISGSNSVQWQLVLEQQSSEYHWPLEKVANTVASTTTKKEKDTPTFKSISASYTASLLSCLSLAEGAGSGGGTGTSSSAAHRDTRPKRLVQFAGHTHLESQRFHGRTYISAYTSHTSLLSMHSADLQPSAMCVYKVPMHCNRALLSERLMFIACALPHRKWRLHVLCTQLCAADTARQQQQQRRTDGRHPIAQHPIAQEAIEQTGEQEIAGQTFTVRLDEEVMGLLTCDWSTGEGCLVLTPHNVYAIRPRISAEELFLSVVLEESDFARADLLAHSLQLDAHLLYEKAAERRLLQSRVIDAVHLYELAKCPHVRSVANLAALGHLSQLLSYVRLLFAKRSSDFSLGDLKHFSNVALYCFVQQSLEQGPDDTVLHTNFRDFLLDNQHYDELLAVHLLAAYDMYGLLAQLCSTRGLLPHMLAEILPSRQELSGWTTVEQVRLQPKWADHDACLIFQRTGYAPLVSLLNNVTPENACKQPQVQILTTILKGVPI